MEVFLENEHLTAVVDTCGGAIQSLRDKQSGAEHVWPYDAQIWPRRTSVCFPVCGRLHGGRYSYAGKSYEMPTHGFLREKELHIDARETGSVLLTHRAGRQTREIYPFAYRLELLYALSGRSLIAEYRVENPGNTEMLFSIGSHYTYLLPRPQSECAFAFSRGQHAGAHALTDGWIGEKRGDVLKGKKQLSMNGLFDHGSLVLDAEDLNTEYIAICTGGDPFTRVSWEGFSQILLWAPKGGESPFVCIECWAGNGDPVCEYGSLEAKPGIHRLESGQHEVFRQIIAV